MPFGDAGDPAQAMAMRRRQVDLSIAFGALLIAAHLPFPLP
jgi:hypothetical protein